MKLFSNFFKTLWAAARLGWAGIVVTAGVFYIRSGGSEILKQQFSVLAWKVILLGTGIAIAHLTRKQLFPYVDLSELAQKDDSRSGLVFLSIAVYYAAVVLALCAGL